MGACALAHVLLGGDRSESTTANQVIARAHYKTSEGVMGNQRPHFNERQRAAKHAGLARGESAERFPDKTMPDEGEDAPRHGTQANRGEQKANDVEQGYSQDSGYPQSGGYERRPADRTAGDDHAPHDDGQEGQIGIFASDDLDAAEYSPAAGRERARERDASGVMLREGARKYSDESIRAALHELLAGRASPRGVLVTVEDGNVTLEGEVADAAEKTELEEIVYQSPGVRSVANLMVARSLRAGPV